MTFNSNEISQLQGIENMTFRRILYARAYTPISALRGEIGSSLMITRIMESKLLLTKNILEGSNSITKQILEASRKDKGNIFNKTLSEYLKKLSISYEELSILSKDNIKNRARKWDTKIWKENMSEKSSLKIYREFKLEIKEEKSYDNRDSSTYLFQARSNTLQLNNRNRHISGDTKCELCNNDNEDLIHFLIDCEGLKHKRKNNIMDKYRNQNKEVMAGNILFSKGDIEEIKAMIDMMWKYRLGKKIENEKRKEILKKE